MLKPSKKIKEKAFCKCSISRDIDHAKRKPDRGKPFVGFKSSVVLEGLIRLKINLVSSKWTWGLAFLDLQTMSQSDRGKSCYCRRCEKKKKRNRRTRKGSKSQKWRFNAENWKHNTMQSTCCKSIFGGGLKYKHVSHFSCVKRLSNDCQKVVKRLPPLCFRQKVNLWGFKIFLLIRRFLEKIWVSIAGRCHEESTGIFFFWNFWMWFPIFLMFLFVKHRKWRNRPALICW